MHEAPPSGRGSLNNSLLRVSAVQRKQHFTHQDSKLHQCSELLEFAQDGIWIDDNVNKTECYRKMKFSCIKSSPYRFLAAGKDVKSKRWQSEKVRTKFQWSCKFDSSRVTHIQGPESVLGARLLRSAHCGALRPSVRCSQQSPGVTAVHTLFHHFSEIWPITQTVKRQKNHSALFHEDKKNQMDSCQDKI